MVNDESLSLVNPSILAAMEAAACTEMLLELRFFQAVSISVSHDSIWLALEVFVFSSVLEFMIFGLTFGTDGLLCAGLLLRLSVSVLCIETVKSVPSRNVTSTSFLEVRKSLKDLNPLVL